MQLLPLSKRTAGYSVWLALLCVFLFSCNTSQKGLFGKKTPHEKYGDGLQSAGLNHTAIGQQWFTAAEKSLNQPLTISLPYQEKGYFAAEKPGAAGYRFSARRGEKLSVKITTVPATGVMVFAELWQAATGTDKPRLLEVADTTTRQLDYEVGKETDLLVRIQPELLKGIEYTLIITTGASLAFPVRSSGNPKMISFWGAGRDGGSRSHEGVDIAAAFRTPVVAAAEGRVTSVTENNLGGKVVFMRPAGKNYNLYYAHLDSQIAAPGQVVQQGDVLGLVGNTGNAVNTTPHLHFGIYTGDGAVDPLPFINPLRPALPAVTASMEIVNEFARNINVANLYSEPAVKGAVLGKLDANTALQVLGATGGWYRVSLPDQREGFISSSVITDKPVRILNSQQANRLLDAPDSTAAAKRIIAAGARFTVLGQYGYHYLVQYGGTHGWIRK